MDKHEAASIILSCISRRVALPWDDCQAVAAAVDEALEEIAWRRQEAGPVVMEMRGGAPHDNMVLRQNHLG